MLQDLVKITKEEVKYRYMKILSKYSTKPQPQDFILKYTILPLIPEWVKPNHITILRFVFTPFVLILLWLELYSIGIPFLIMVAFTDAIDGSLARVRNQITEWGKIYDPLADKLLLNSSLLIVAIKYFFWTTLTIVLIDLGFIFAGWRWKKKGIDISANIWGKAKMNFQVIGLVLLLLALYFNAVSFFYLSLIILFLAIIFAVVSFFTYGM